MKNVLRVHRFLAYRLWVPKSINNNLSDLLAEHMTHPLLSLLFPQTLMLVSSTTRPLLGCVWNFPSTIGLAYATTSLVIHEMIPIILMAITNLTSLYTLYTHGRNPQKDAPVLKRVPAEKRAAKVRKKGALEVDEGVSGCVNECKM